MHTHGLHTSGNSPGDDIERYTNGNNRIFNIKFKMTLFLKTPKRILEIDDNYVMGFTFVIGVLVVRISSRVKEKIDQKKKSKRKKFSLKNYRGGSNEGGIRLTDDHELAMTILTCIADNDVNIVINQKLRNLIFELVKQKIKNESLVITPNLIRFVALKILCNYH